MRTTVVLDDELLARARRVALESGLTLSDVVNRALRESLAPRAPPEQTRRFSMPTWGELDEGGPVHHEPADLAAAQDDDERASLARG